jgi:hypothetical protein
MAGRVTFHKVIRKIHLVASMVLLTFMLFYSITGIIISNRKLIQIPEAKVTHSSIPVEVSIREEDPKAYAKYLGELLDARGRIEYQKDWKENWIFHFTFPGEDYQVILTPARDTLHIRQTVQERTLFIVSQRLHSMRGFKGGWHYTAWAIGYDVTACSMVIFAITGVIIWFRMRNKYRNGWWYLSAGILIPLIIVFAFLLSK